MFLFLTFRIHCDDEEGDTVAERLRGADRKARLFVGAGFSIPGL